jgi:hypothetical protein
MTWRECASATWAWPCTCVFALINRKNDQFAATDSTHHSHERPPGEACRQRRIHDCIEREHDTSLHCLEAVLTYYYVRVATPVRSANNTSVHYPAPVRATIAYLIQVTRHVQLTFHTSPLTPQPPNTRCTPPVIKPRETYQIQHDTRHLLPSDVPLKHAADTTGAGQRCHAS